MHELSIAHAVVSTVLDALPPGEVRVQQVRLSIGRLSGVVPQALEFAYDVAVQDTALADAVLVIEQTPIVIDCSACGEQEIADPRSFVCPQCDTPCGNVIRGKELEIVDITLDDALVDPGVVVSGVSP
jgi:hydrogenase nickel incorporation protein HypA/HybF